LNLASMAGLNFGSTLNYRSLINTKESLAEFMWPKKSVTRAIVFLLGGPRKKLITNGAQAKTKNFIKLKSFWIS
jgi:hypothetical protein